MKPENHLWGRKLNQLVMACLGLAVLIGLVRAGSAFTPWLIPIGALFWAYLVSVVFLVEWAALHTRMRKAPAIPLLSRVAGRRALLIGLCVYVAAFTLAREGAFSPHFVLTVNQYKTNATTDFRTETSSNSMEMSDGEPVRLAGRPAQCLVDCQPLGSTVCEAVLDAISCDDEPTAEGAIFVQAHINVSEEPFCFVPLFKSAKIQFTGTASITGNNPRAAANHSLTVYGTTRLEMTGVGSCYTFRKLLGAEVGRNVVSAVNNVLSNN